jgi:hypothetical protein
LTIDLPTLWRRTSSAYSSSYLLVAAVAVVVQTVSRPTRRKSPRDQREKQSNKFEEGVEWSEGFEKSEHVIVILRSLMFGIDCLEGAVAVQETCLNCVSTPSRRPISPDWKAFLGERCNSHCSK